MKKLLVIAFLLNTCLAFSQTVYKKGYITTLENKTVEGFVLIQKSNTYYHQVSFTTDKKTEPTVYTPDMIQGYGYSETTVFKSIEIPTIYRGFLMKDEPVQKKFLKVLTTSKNVILYTFGEKDTKCFFIKNKGATVTPLLFKRNNVDNYKISEERYKLPSGEVLRINKGENAFLIANDKKIFFYENEVLYQALSVYKDELRKISLKEDCDIEDEVEEVILTEASITQFLKKIERCTEDKLNTFFERPSPQVSVLAMGSTHPYTRNLHIGYEYGFLLEFRENRLSPNYSVAVGFFRNDVTNTFTEYHTESSLNYLNARITSNTGALKLSYHAREGKNLRPYASVTSRVLIYQADYLRLGSNKLFISKNEIDSVLGISVGVDYYLFRYVQLRSEVEFSGVFSYQIGLGFSIN